MEYLEFEKPIEELMEQYDKCSLVGEESGIDVKLACSQLEDKIIAEKYDFSQEDLVALSRAGILSYLVERLKDKFMR